MDLTEYVPALNSIKYNFSEILTHILKYYKIVKTNIKNK